LNHSFVEEIPMKNLIVIVALAALSPSVALAHAQLASSVPADQAVLESPPKELALHFTEAVRLTAVTVARDAEAAKQIDSLPTGAMKDFSLAPPALAAGRYRVSWRALAADSHVMTGSFTFSVSASLAPADPSRDHAGHSQH
jgi:methionine-rich copper-binding protein CopC